MRKFVWLMPIFLLFCGISNFLCIESEGANTAEQLSTTRYIDPKGYFKIVPPAGWKIQEFPQDTRGKVAFFAPETDVDLRVLVNAVDFSTIDKLIAFCKDVENRIGTTTNIEQITFCGRPAVRRTFQLKGRKFYYIDFLVGKVDHNIAYSASLSKYEKYLPVIMKSIETYGPNFREISNKEVVDHIIAKNARLAQLMINDGNFDLASEFIKEGLDLSPKDPELLKLKIQIEEKRKK